MLGWLAILFIALPLADLVLLLRVGGLLGFWPTCGLVVLTGIVGAWLARRQGVRTLGRVRSELAAGRMPGEDLADGALILLAAALLVTPGFLTDLLGILLLVPPARRVIRGILGRHFQRRMVVTYVDVRGVSQASPAPRAGAAGSLESADWIEPPQGERRVVSSRVVDGREPEFGSE
jgi:UPF0716 protein FxsA